MGMLFPFFSNAQGKYTLKGSLAMQDISGDVYLNYKNGKNYVRDSAVVKNGKFVIYGKVVEPVQASLKLKYKIPGSKLNIETREIYLDNEQFFITIKDSLKNAELINSAINTEWEKYKKVLEESRIELNNVVVEIRNSPDEKQKDTALLNKRKFKLLHANKILDSILGNYILQNSDSYFSFSALEQIAGPYFEVEKIESIIKKLSPRLQNSKRGKKLKISVQRALVTSIGKLAPDFMRKDIHNEDVSLLQYRGKYVLLDFWASWCAPCRAENPNVLEAYNSYKSKNFTVVGLSVDRKEDRGKWLNAVKSDRLPWTQIIDSEDKKSTADLYSIKSIPANYLINPDGIIIAKNLRGKQLQMLLAQLL